MVPSNIPTAFGVAMEAALVVVVFIICLPALGCTSGKEWFRPYGPAYNFGKGSPSDSNASTVSDFLGQPRPGDPP